MDTLAAKEHQESTEEDKNYFVKYHLKEQRIPSGFETYIECDGVEVSGIHHRLDAAAKFANQKDNTWLEFEPEPLNKFDNYAIKVLGCYKENNEIVKLHVGYVPAILAKQINLFSVNECIPRLFKTYIGKSGFVEIRFQLLGPKGRGSEFYKYYESPEIDEDADECEEEDDDDDILKTLSSNAIKMVLEKPKLWRYRLFFQVWIDELNSLHNKINQYNNLDEIIKSKHLDNENFAEFGKLRLSEIGGYVDNVKNLINISANKVFGAPDKNDNHMFVILIAKEIVELLDKIIDWSINIRSYKSEEPFTRVLNAMSKFTESAIANLQEFPHSSLNKIEESLSCSSEHDKQNLDLSIDFDLSNFDEFNSAIDVLNQHL